MTQTIDTAILGASGYTGAELLRLLENHPQIRIRALTGDSQAGKPIANVYPHLRHRNLPDLVKHTEVNFSAIDLVFCCLPHGTTQEIIAGLPSHVKIVDLSADFRLQDGAQYAQWYGHEHRALELQKTAVYGLTEHAREQVRSARLVANPGCYPTASLLPLLPLLARKMVRAESLVIDALSGVSGAGRSVKQEMLFCEVDGGVSAYGIGAHRHMAEMEQEISRIVGEAITISFTPHLVPMPRGMLATIHAPLSQGITVEDVRHHLRSTYEGEAFVHVLESGSAGTHQVRGTNHCFISAHAGRIAGELILISVIDNLVKGASGQAIQNANLMFECEETAGLMASAVFP